MTSSGALACAPQLPLQPAPRSAGVDVLRGLAIILVVIHHLALPFRLPLGPSQLGDVLAKRIINAISFNGYEAVFLFFVISGFVITQRALQQHGDLAHLDWRAFYLRRAGRILPLLAVLLLVLNLFHALGVPDYVVNAPGQSVMGATVSALTMTLNWYEGRTNEWLPGAWDVLWSLSIEEAFYLLFPLLCLCLPRRLLVLSLLLLMLSAPWTHAALQGQEIWQEKAYLPGMSAIACGVLTALWNQHLRATGTLSLRTTWALCLLGVVGLLAVMVWGGFVWRSLKHANLLVLMLGSAAAVLSLNILLPLAPRGWGWLAEMGRLSYEIYLSHMFIVLTATTAYRALMGDNLRWTWLVYLPCLWLCLLLARALQRWVSEPAAAWLRDAVPSRTVAA